MNLIRLFSIVSTVKYVSAFQIPNIDATAKIKPPSQTDRREFSYFLPPRQMLSSLYPASFNGFRISSFHSSSGTNLAAQSDDQDDSNEDEVEDKRRASVSFSSPSTPGEPFSNPTDLVDYVLSVLTSDIGSGILGLIGIVICLCNRLSSIDYDALTIDPTAAAAMGQQSRSDLLGVFASGAVLLNGLSKLDVTSVLAEKVVLEGVELPRPIIIHSDENLASDMDWALNSIIAATPANTAVVLKFVKEKWIPLAIAGVVPFEKELQTELPLGSATPILNRFLTQKAAKESYLPTLQALPGKVEFTYLPKNTQEALLLPIQLLDDGKRGVLVLGSDTAKNFSPRDVAWSQVIASRMGKFLLSSI